MKKSLIFGILILLGLSMAFNTEALDNFWIFQSGKLKPNIASWGINIPTPATSTFGSWWIGPATNTTGYVLKLTSSGEATWQAETAGGGGGTDTWTIAGTGMYATDTISNIYVGTSSAPIPLTVYGTTSIYNGNLSIATDTDGYVYFDAQGEYLLWDNGVARFFLSDDIATNDSMTIGTDLTVSGTSTFTGTSTFNHLSAGASTYFEIPHYDDCLGNATGVMCLDINDMTGGELRVYGVGGALNIVSTFDEPTAGEMLTYYSGLGYPVWDNSITVWQVNGRVGMGTTSPAYKLEVYASSTDGYFGVSRHSATSGTIFIIDENGNVGINNNVPAEKLEVGGNISLSGTLTATSSITGSNITEASTTKWNAAYTKSLASTSGSWGLYATTSAGMNKAFWKTPQAVTAVEFGCITDGTSVSLSCGWCSESGFSTSSQLANLVCDIDSASTTAFQDSSGNERERLMCQTTAVSSSTMYHAYLKYDK